MINSLFDNLTIKHDFFLFLSEEGSYLIIHIIGSQQQQENIYIIVDK
jgi:hypothetical protein